MVIISMFSPCTILLFFCDIFPQKMNGEKTNIKNKSSYLIFIDFLSWFTLLTPQQFIQSYSEASTSGAFVGFWKYAQELFWLPHSNKYSFNFVGVVKLLASFISSLFWYFMLQLYYKSLVGCFADAAEVGFPKCLAGKFGSGLNQTTSRLLKKFTGYMMLKRWSQVALLLLLGLFASASGAFVGINIGTDVTDLPSETQITAILKAHQITHLRLYNADVRLLKALSNSGIEVTVGVTNEEVLGIGETASKAAAWVNKNVAAYLPSTNITAIAVGSEVLSTIPHLAPVLVSAMNNIHKALVAANLNFRVKVSTPQSVDIIPRPFPPSTATFDDSGNSTIYKILQFLKNTKSYYMLNAYPYYGYTKGNGIFPIDYALFKPLPSVKQIVDPNTLFHYNSMFDAMVDATYYSIEALNFSGIPIVVTETGWPWFGGSNEPDANVQNAETFNNNLIRRVLNGSGPPSQPNFPINTYIYELFNEDKRPGPVSEKNWGVLFVNGSSVYPLSLTASNQITGNSSAAFCVAKADADPDKLQDGLNWACGPGHANCTAIQEGEPCYTPNAIPNHASYAYNDYYQRTHSVGGTCDFDGTAMATAVDPSYGSCIFAGSSNSSTSRGLFPPTALGPVSPFGGWSSSLEASKLQLLIPATLFALSLL